jgi:hypothetical protein
MVADGLRFFEELDSGESIWQSDDYDVHLIRGQNQRTPTIARRVGGGIELSPLIEGVDEHGDGTVPALSSIPNGLRPSSPIVRHVTARHGSLQHDRSILDELVGAVTASDVIRLGRPRIALDLRVDDVYEAGEPIDVVVAFPDGDEAAVEALLVDEQGKTVQRQRVARDHDRHVAVLRPPVPGGYQVRTMGADSMRGRVAEVTAPLLVWNRAEP